MNLMWVYKSFIMKLLYVYRNKKKQSQKQNINDFRSFEKVITLWCHKRDDGDDSAVCFPF